jgi:hypothetical protein
MIAEDPYDEFVRSATTVLKRDSGGLSLGGASERLRLSASIVQTAAERSHSEWA